MIHTKSFPILSCLFLLVFSCTPKGNADGQPTTTSTTRNLPSGGCEDCELMFVGMPKNLNAVDTSRGWVVEGQKLVVSGKILKLDQKTPAENVILYYYHTDMAGEYSYKEGLPLAARRHGYLRGWVQTGHDGQFNIYTSKPAQYPGGTTEAHIHILVKEPDINIPYWIDAWVFDDDPLLTQDLRKRLENRGGSGIMKLQLENGILRAEQNVILGLNVPGYPVN